MSNTADQMRAWQGSAILSFGFRPFFFGAAVWAALSMALWVPMFSGRPPSPRNNLRLTEHSAQLVDDRDFDLAGGHTADRA